MYIDYMAVIYCYTHLMEYIENNMPEKMSKSGSMTTIAWTVQWKKYI